MATTLILRAAGKGWYQYLELDAKAGTIVAAWPQREDSEANTPRLRDRPVLRPSELKGELGKAYRVAFKAWDGRAFNFDRPEEIVPPGTRLVLRQASSAGGFARPWVARIDGADPAYRFARRFVEPDDRDRKPGGNWTYYLPDGYYEVCNRNSTGAERRWFARVGDGACTEIERAEIEAAFPEVPVSAGAAPVPTPAPVAEDLNSTKGRALAMARRVPVGVRREDFLPFVTACLEHFDAAQAEALDADATAASFAIAGEQILYRRDFRRLTGRDHDPRTDRITRDDVLAFPVTPPAPARPVVYECLECGAVYPPEKAHLIDAGGMGCARCNH